MRITEVREKIDRYGIENVDGDVLLGVVTGKNIKVEDFYDGLARCNSVEDIVTKFRVTKGDATKLLATLEIGKRICERKALLNLKLGSPATVADYLRPHLRYENKEHFLVLLLNTKNRLIKKVEVSLGNLNSSVVHPREVFKEAILHNAAAIIIAHNHPSGECTPSKEDMETTKSIVESGKTLGIPCLDHIIIGGNGYYSFQEEGNINA